MGNVLAASAVQTSTPVKMENPSGHGDRPKDSGSLQPPLVPPDSVEQGSKCQDSSINPGPMEELHKKCKDVFPTPFEGARFIINKGLSNHFQISHTLNMSSASPSGYRFGATYVGTNVVGPGEAYPVLLGDIDPSGNVNANMLHQFGPKIKSKCVAQIQDSRCVATQFSTDYKGDDFTASVTLGNFDLVSSSGIGILHYLQSVTRRLDIGAELAYQFGQQIPGGSVGALSLAARYASPNNFVLSGTLSGSGAHLCYYHKGRDNLQIGVEVETNLRMQDSTATIGYQLDIPRADLVFRGSVDSNLQVSAVMEKKLQPMPFTLLLSGHLNHSKNQSYKFGCGLLIG